ncbi:ASCH domain-containing protein [Paenibacillus macerans]|uniref:ASCH domain-containing protein n=1 Tax=Paenibacillus macerans TaxID=44252 RepID=UPI003D31442A
MKTITIHQPWASLIAVGAKKFETRSWKTNYRGPIAIHASMKGLPHLWFWDKPMLQEFEERGIDVNDLPKGCVVATANLTNCIKSVDTWTDGYILEDGRYIYTPEYEFGDFTPGRYAWELTNVIRLASPIPVKGQQGLWNWEGRP